MRDVQRAEETSFRFVLASAKDSYWFRLATPSRRGTANYPQGCTPFASIERVVLSVSLQRKQGGGREGEPEKKFPPTLYDTIPSPIPFHSSPIPSVLSCPSRIQLNHHPPTWVPHLNCAQRGGQGGGEKTSCKFFLLCYLCSMTRSFNTLSKFMILKRAQNILMRSC